MPLNHPLWQKIPISIYQGKELLDGCQGDGPTAKGRKQLIENLIIKNLFLYGVLK